jgi:hypothetical protein
MRVDACRVMPNAMLFLFSFQILNMTITARIQLLQGPR